MAALTYAVASNVKARLGITGDTYNNVIAGLCDQTNAFIERRTHRPVGPDSVTQYTVDGYDALENGRLLLFPRGVRSLTTVEVATTTGGSFSTIASGDYFLRPAAYQVEPGWPQTEIWITDIPSASTTVPYFPQGFANVRLTGTFGWASIPPDLIEVAEVTVVRAFNARQTGQLDTTGSEETGEALISRLLDIRDLRTIDHYRWNPVFVVGD